ncbi:hypothetical protein EDB80DRAFT_89311 [Ilyonectria destructans]|nr:hypothetical protein EDB80DRAFT_89311 [Ilyonectria destructans]
MIPSSWCLLAHGLLGSILGRQLLPHLPNLPARAAGLAMLRRSRRWKAWLHADFMPNGRCMGITCAPPNIKIFCSHLRTPLCMPSVLPTKLHDGGGVRSHMQQFVIPDSSAKPQIPE